MLKHSFVILKISVFEISNVGKFVNNQNERKDIISNQKHTFNLDLFVVKFYFSLRKNF